MPVDVSSGVVRAAIEGPDNPFLVKPEKVPAEFTASISTPAEFVKLVVGDEERLLRVGEWSDWVPVDVRADPDAEPAAPRSAST